MAYRQGDLQMTDPPCQDMEEDGYCKWGDRHVIYDNRLDQKAKGVVFLPHSCDEWVIGDADKVLELLLDLAEVYCQLRPKDGLTIAYTSENPVSEEIKTLRPDWQIVDDPED